MKQSAVGFICGRKWLNSALIVAALFSAVRCGTDHVCPYPGRPQHSNVVFSDDTWTPDTTATYNCDLGYELLGPSSRVCSSNLTWIPDQIPFCVLNVAAGKAPLQSSTMAGGVPQKAVDGSTAPFFAADTCSLTLPEPAPWWYVNLLEPYVVQLVRIDFGQSCCGVDGPPTLVVRVGNNRPDLGVNPICNRYTGFVEEGRPLFLPCTTAMTGAFVSVHFLAPASASSAGPSSSASPQSSEASAPAGAASHSAAPSGGGVQPLSLCELFVYTSHAVPVERCPSFRDQPLGSVATYNGRCYIFYNNQRQTFAEANATCASRGGSLVADTSPALQGFLSWELYRRHRNDPRAHYWMGAVRSSAGSGRRHGDGAAGPDEDGTPGDDEAADADTTGDGWRWLDGRPMTVSFWSGPPATASAAAAAVEEESRDCAKFDGGRGWLWNVERCDEALHFICQHQPTTCGRPERPVNSTLLESTNEVGSIIEYRCDPGNLLIGPNIRTCLPNGFFSEYPPRCKYVDCGRPPSTANGQLRLLKGTTHYLSSVQYTCNPGFVLVGRAQLVCDVDGRWSGASPRCEAITCQDPPRVQHADVQLSSVSLVFGTTADYACKDGYELEESTSPRLRCGPEGYWEGGVHPRCVRRQTPPPPSSPLTSPAVVSAATSTSATVSFAVVEPGVSADAVVGGVDRPASTASATPAPSPAGSKRYHPDFDPFKGGIFHKTTAAVAAENDDLQQATTAARPPFISGGASIGGYPVVGGATSFDIGGVGVVVSSADDASHSSRRPAYVGGSAQRSPPPPSSSHSSASSTPIPPVFYERGSAQTVRPRPRPPSLPSGGASGGSSPRRPAVITAGSSGSSNSAGHQRPHLPGMTGEGERRVHADVYPDPHGNEILHADDSRSIHVSSAPPAAARLNMGGFIALGVFGGFVVLSAIITIIVLIVRRNPKGSRKAFVTRLGRDGFVVAGGGVGARYGGAGAGLAGEGLMARGQGLSPAHLTRISPVYCSDETDTVSSTAADDSTVLHQNYKRAWDTLKVDMQDDLRSQHRPDSDKHLQTVVDYHQHQLHHQQHQQLQQQNQQPQHQHGGYRRPKGAWTYAPAAKANN